MSRSGKYFTPNFKKEALNGVAYIMDRLIFGIMVSGNAHLIIMVSGSLNY